MKQLHNFVGNCLQVKNIYGNHVMCLSKTAYNSLSHNQKNLINKACSGGIAIINYSTIEKTRGGSVR